MGRRKRSRAEDRAFKKALWGVTRFGRRAVSSDFTCARRPASILCVRPTEQVS